MVNEPGEKWGYGVAPLLGDPGGVPLVIEARSDPSLPRLLDQLRGHPDWLEAQLNQHGALLFRGFEVRSAADFERLARCIDDDLKRDYLGTSPRDAVTDYVFSASELPGFYPIPQHCEMSFLPEPPRHLFFCCLVEPAPGSGETPLTDFRRVARDLPPEVRRRFVDGGLRIVRNYAGPDGTGAFDFWKLKRWDEMFGTPDVALVEEKCRKEGFDLRWTQGGGLRLISTQPVLRSHPQTGEEVWHNHSTTFHLSMAPGEFARIQRLRPSLRQWLLLQLSRALVAWKRRTPTDRQAMHCTYLDGREIPDEDIEAVREAVWKHTVIFPWKRGDVVAIDNFSVAHGRLPYHGPRQVVVCWA